MKALREAVRELNAKGRAGPLDRIPLVEGNTIVGIALDGQVYRFVGLRIHEKADGSVTELHGWVTDCPDCGTRFEIMTIPLRRFQPNRRCKACAKPGHSPVPSNRIGDFNHG